MKPTQPHLYHNQTRLARWIKILADPYLLSLRGVLAIDCYKLPYLNGMLAMLSNPEFNYFAAEYAFAQQIGMFYLLMLPFIIIWIAETLLIIRWLYRTATNTYALNIPSYHQPHWSVTSYITPFVGLVFGWTIWLASSLINAVLSRWERPSETAIAIEHAGNAHLPAIPPEAIQQQINPLYLDVAGYALSFICFYYLFNIIQRTNQAQNALATQQGSLKP